MFDRMDESITREYTKHIKHHLCEQRRRDTIVENEQDIRIILRSFKTSKHALYFQAANEIYRLSGMTAPQPDLITESGAHKVYQQKNQIACQYLKNALINARSPFTQMNSMAKVLCATKNFLCIMENFYACQYRN